MTGWCARARRWAAWRWALPLAWLCCAGGAFAAGIPATLAWQPVAAGAALPDTRAWKAMEAGQVTPIDRAPDGAWLRVAPAAAAWPDSDLAIELRLRALGAVSLIDARGAVLATASLDTPRPDSPGGYGVTLVSVPRPAERTAPLLLRLEPHHPGGALVDVVVRSAADEMAADERRLAFISACLSLLGCTAVYALLFGSTMRDPTYFHYAAYVLGFAGIQALVTGFGIKMLGLNAVAGWRPEMMAACVGVSTWGAARFLCGFVDLPQHAPRIARLLTALGDGLLALCLLALLPLPLVMELLRIVVNPLLIVVALVMLAGSLIALAHGSRYVRFYLLGWLPLLVVTVVDSAQAFGAFAPWTDVADAMLAAGTFETVVLVFAISFRARDLRSDGDRSRQMAETDGLTGVLNRRGWERQLEAVMGRARQRREPVTLLFLDLDHFKSFNDHHGHASGDLLLMAVVEAIGRELRPDDLFGRFGGEEFVIVLPGCSELRARGTAERVRACVARLSVPVRDGSAGATVSIGISEIAPDETPQAAIARADNAMYQAKRAGRNRTSAA